MADRAVLITLSSLGGQEKRTYMRVPEGRWTKIGVVAGVMSMVSGFVGLAYVAVWPPFGVTDSTLPKAAASASPTGTTPAGTQTSPQAPDFVRETAGVAAPGPGDPGRAASRPAQTPEPGQQTAPPTGQTERIAPDEARLTTLDCAQESGFSSARTVEVTSIQFYNERSEPIAVHWLDFDGNRQPWTTLEPRTKVKLQTYISHFWVASTTSGTCLGVYAARSNPGAAVVTG
jgi:hypothetical protein